MAIDGVTSCMKIREVNKNKKQFISLLLLADEQESMVDRYLEKGTMYVLEDNEGKAECVVTDEGNGILEIKNIAVDPENQGKGYGKALIDFLASKYADEYSVLQVGTGDSPLTIPFYEKNELCIIHILSANSICKMSLSKIQNFLFFESGDYVKTTRFFT